MAEPSGAEIVARVLKEEGVEHFFGVHGGHVWSLLIAICGKGIKMMHMRHEQSGVYAADGWARTTKRPGVCFGTAGPGMLNMVAGLEHAYLSESPVIALLGQHRKYEDGWRPFQEGYGEDICRSLTKWTRRLVDERTIGYHTRKAFRDAMAYPPGPVGLEFPTDILDHRTADLPDERDYLPQRGFAPKERYPDLGHPQGDPSLVKEAVRMLLEADRPAIIGGNGIYWSDAINELREFVELTQIPVHTRRMARGAVPENHPLAFAGGYRRPILGAADVIAVLGLRFSSLENFGLPPTYSANAKYIQISESTEEISSTLPTDMAIIGSPKLVLRQMIDYVKSRQSPMPKRKEWLATIAKAQAAAVNEVEEEVAKLTEANPINPNFLCKEIVDFLDPTSTIILDSFSGAGFITDKIQAKYAGQVLDAGSDGGVGHSVGMGIGAQLGRPGKQILALIGDGGIGIGGMDIETAARYKLPVCYVVLNNSGWISTEFQKIVCPGVDSWGMLPDIRYDKMFAENSCHGEFVTRPEELRPALERAFNSEKTSLVNVIVDNKIMAPLHVQRAKAYKRL